MQIGDNHIDRATFVQNSQAFLGALAADNL
jgi:hypothetical protein